MLKFWDVEMLARCTSRQVEGLMAMIMVMTMIKAMTMIRLEMR